MANSLFEEAQKSYALGNFQDALSKFIKCAQDLSGFDESELCKFYHLLGNCYIKCSRPSAASAAYSMALESATSDRKPALYVNLGTSLLASEKNTEALVAFNNALQFEDYAARYKAYSGIGAAQLQLGNVVEAGAAYREAAIDRTNPSPAKALVNLGVSFMEMGRADDAIVSYETALDLGLDGVIKNKAYANLGQAYMSQGRFFDALEVFEAATEDGSYKLNDMASHDYAIAKSLDLRYGDDLDELYLAKSDELFDNDGKLKKPYQTGEINVKDSTVKDDNLEEDNSSDKTLVYNTAAGTAGAAAAAKMTGKKQEAHAQESEVDEAGMNPDLLETSSFFLEPKEEQEESKDEMFEPSENHYSNASEDAFMSQPYSFEVFDEDAANKKKRAKKKRRRTLIGILIAVIIVFVLALTAAGVGYFLGYGIPLQEQVVTNEFKAVQSNDNPEQYWSSKVDKSLVKKKCEMISHVDQSEVVAVERSTNSSAVYVKAHLKEGGTVYYCVKMSRNMASWSIDDIDFYWPNA